MLRSIIIEDELASQELLSSIIKEYCQDIENIGVAASRDEGVKMILSLKPDLVFMDVHLGDDISFEILDILPNKDFKLIITTAYAHYALTAFKYEAVDYILKPYSPKEVMKAVKRVVEQQNIDQKFGQLEKILQNNNGPKDPEKITLSTSEGLRIYKINNITRVEAFGPYCKIFSNDNKPITLSKTLKEIESLLPSTIFFRVHDSHLINLRLIKEVKKDDGGVVVLENNDEIPVSRRKKQEFLEKIL